MSYSLSNYITGYWLLPFEIQYSFGFCDKQQSQQDVLTLMIATTHRYLFPEPRSYIFLRYDLSYATLTLQFLKDRSLVGWHVGVPGTRRSSEGGRRQVDLRMEAAHPGRQKACRHASWILWTINQTCNTRGSSQFLKDMLVLHKTTMETDDKFTSLVSTARHWFPASVGDSC